MRPYSEALGIRVYCSVCGGGGIVKIPNHFGFNMAHSDPRICSERLAREAKRLSEKEAELKSPWKVFFAHMKHAWKGFNQRA